MTADTAPPSTPHPGPLGALDHHVLEQLRVDLEDEDGTAVASLVSIYVASTQGLIPGLATALRSGDNAAAAGFAHALASPSALIGAGPLGALLQRVQDAHHTGAPQTELAALADTVSRESQRVIAALAAFTPMTPLAADSTWPAVPDSGRPPWDHDR